MIPTIAFPAEAGIHLAAPVPVEPWIPAFAGNAGYGVNSPSLSRKAEPK